VGRAGGWECGAALRGRPTPRAFRCRVKLRLARRTSRWKRMVGAFAVVRSMCSRASARRTPTVAFSNTVSLREDGQGRGRLLAQRGVDRPGSRYRAGGLVSELARTVSAGSQVRSEP